MGLKGGKTIGDDTDLSGCGLAELASKGKKLMMMGSTAKAVIKAPEKEITCLWRTSPRTSVRLPP